MPRGGSRPGAGRPKKQSVIATESSKQSKSVPQVDPDGFKDDPSWPFGKQAPDAPADLSELTPLDFLLDVMRDQTEEKGRRMQAAQLAAPYCHAKMGEGGKKEAKQEAAKKVASKFTPSAPPKLVAAGGKKV